MTTVSLDVSQRNNGVGIACGRSSYLHKSSLAAHWLQTLRDRLRKLVSCVGVAIAVLTILFSDLSHAAIVFQEDFSGTALDLAKWRELAFHGQRISVSGGTAIFNSQNYADTCGRYAFSGDNGIVIEARMRGPGPNRDTHVEVIEAATGDVIIAGDTSYSPGGLYTAASGQFYSYQGGTEVSTAAYKEYRFSVIGNSLVIARGDTLANLTESRSVTLSASIVGKVFYLRIGTGGPVHQPGEFDWVRVNGTLASNPNVCSTAGLLGLTVSSVTPNSATLDTPTVFEVSGYQLPSGLGFTLGDCTPADSEVVDATTSSSLRKFRCTPRGSPGLKYGRVKTSPTGTTLANFQVNVVASSVAATVDRFQFDMPIAAQQTGVAFPIRIRALDSAGNLITVFNSPVRVSDAGGKPLAQSVVMFSGGQFVGNATVLRSGGATLASTFVRPNGTTASGVSNVFAVSAPSDALSFPVTGVTEPGALVEMRPVTGVAASVYPVADHTKVAGSTVSTIAGSDGKFKFPNIVGGTYGLRGTKSGYVQANHLNSILVDQKLSFSLSLKLQNAQPVLVVPGVLGSTLKPSRYSKHGVDPPNTFAWAFVGRAPKLPQDRCAAAPCPLAADLEIYDPQVKFGGHYDPIRGVTTAMGSRLLIDALQAAGFSVDTAPWDWRETYDDAWRKYLKPKIDQLKAVSPTGKVHIVAHSMGGLLARAYIQSSEYADDIDKLVMIGTPNEGSTNAYYLMEGGVPEDIDAITRNLLQATVDLSFYTAATNELYRSVYPGQSLYETQVNGVQNRLFVRVSNRTARDVKSFLTTKVPGGRDLLPTYDFLRQCSAPQFAYVGCTTGNLDSSSGLNQALSLLNSDNTVNRFVPINATIASGAMQVKTNLILSNNKSTLRTLGYILKGSAGGPFERGIPVSSDGRVFGDATVPMLLGAPLTNVAWSIARDARGTHAYMFGDSRGEVVAALLGNSSAKVSANSTVSAAAVTEPLFRASFALRGDYDILLQSPIGLQSGTSGIGEILEAIPNSEVANFSQLHSVNLINAVSGIYLVNVKGAASLLRTTPLLLVDYADGNIPTQQESARFIKQGSDYVLRVSVDRASSQPIQILEAVAAPTQLRASRSSVGTLLSWPAAHDSTVVGYRIYAHRIADMTVDLLGNTAGTTFSSDLPWASSDEDVQEFIVVSINASGEESFVTSNNSILNRSYVASQFVANTGASAAANGTTLPLSVTFTDQSQSTSPITAWAWDFNSDGVIDSTVRNPTFAFPAYGQYTVSLTVTTEDGVDTAVKPALVTVSPCAPLQQSASCSLDVNGDGRVDARDGLLILRRMLGFSGAALTDGVVNASCSSVSTQATIASFVDNQLAGGHYNFDGGPSGATAASSGLIIYRALQGLTDSGVTASTVRPGATRTTWAGSGQIRDYLNAQCRAGL